MADLDKFVYSVQEDSRLFGVSRSDAYSTTKRSRLCTGIRVIRVAQINQVSGQRISS